MEIKQVEYNQIICKENGTNAIVSPYLGAYIIKSACRVIHQGESRKIFPDCIIISKVGERIVFEAFDSPVFADFFLFESKEEYPFGVTDDNRCSEVTQLIRTMKNEDISERQNSKEILSHYGEIFFLLAQRIINEKSLDRKVHAFYKLREDIYNQPYKPWKVEEIINSSGLSRRQFYYSYKAVFNTSIKQDIINSRLEYARYLLTNTDMRITEVAQNCCFTSDQHFVQTFSKRYGTTPTKFRFNFLRFHTKRKD